MTKVKYSKKYPIAWYANQGTSAALGIAAAAEAGGNLNVGYQAYSNANQFLENVQGMVDDSSQTKNMPKGKGKPMGQGIMRSTMKKSGKNLKKHKTKSVKVSKYLRAAIKQVDCGIMAKGKYKQIMTGAIGTITDLNTNTKLNSDTDNPFNGQSTVQTLENAAPAGGRTLFNQLMQFSASPSLPSLTTGSDLNFFTPGKILNAASVLFNTKYPTTSPYSPGGNLSTHSDGGAPIVTNAGTLKIHVKSSYVKVTIKNVSVRVMHVDAWELTPKLKFQSKVPIESVRALTPLMIESGAKELSLEYTTNEGTARPYGELLQDGTIDPFKALSRVGFNFVGPRKSMCLAPQETCTHFIKGPSGVLDYGKLFVDGNYQNGLLKGWSTSLVLGTRVDQTLTSAYRVGRFAYFDSANPGLMTNPIAVEIEEVYDICVPEIAGFLYVADATAGLPQALSLRKYKMSIANFSESQGTGSSANLVANEENPTAFSAVNSVLA